MLITAVVYTGRQSYLCIQPRCAACSVLMLLLVLKMRCANRTHCLSLLTLLHRLCRQHEHRLFGMPLWVPALL
jgi:hypothetical protein